MNTELQLWPGSHWRRKGGREKSLRRKRACWVPYVEWLGAVWSYSKCWKLCWKLVDFGIQSCWLVLCAMFHRTSNDLNQSCWLVLCAMFHRTSNDLERCDHTINVENYAENSLNSVFNHADQFCVLFFIRSQRSIIPAQRLNRVFRVQFERQRSIIPAQWLNRVFFVFSSREISLFSYLDLLPKVCNICLTTACEAISTNLATVNYC